jgi:hypothetical protein
MVFSDTTNKNGLVQFYEKEIGANYGDVSGNAELLAEFTARVNKTLDNYLLLWSSSAGTWQGDDQNFTNYPIITANIVSGQRDYSFTVDDNSNRITDVSKVLILPSATATEYVPITPIDELTTGEILTNTNTGIPRQYGKLSNAIFLDVIPNYSKSAGIKMVVNREGSYATVSDTTKIMGVPVYHEYFYLRPAYEIASIKGLSNLAELRNKVMELEGDEKNRITGKIQEFFSTREKDADKRITMSDIIFT